MRAQHILVVYLAVTPWAAAQDALTLSSLRLPDAVSVHAIGHRNDEAEFSDQWHVTESLDAVWAQQDWYEGGVGFVPLAVTTATTTDTLLYDVRTRRGVKNDRLRTHGTTRVDGIATPLAWVRYAHDAAARGDTLSQSASAGGEIIVKLTADRMTGRSFECTINPATQELVEVRRADGSYARYSDWRDIGNGRHMPFAIEHFNPGAGTAPPLTRHYQVHAADAADPKAPLAPFLFPPDAAIEDQRTGTVTNGSGQVISLPAAPPAPTAPMASVPISASLPTQGTSHFLTMERVAVGGGATLALVALGGIWFKKRT